MEDGDETAEATAAEEEEDEEGEETTRHVREQRTDDKRKPCCKTARIDELATPNKRIFLALWNEHAYHLPKDKVKHLKELLQQLYAMSPEETAKYFAELQAEARCAAIRNRLKQKLRKYLMEKHHQKQKQKAYKLFRKLLKCGISYAASNPVPPLVSIRLRYLSDIILEQLSCLRQVEVPSRSNPDQLGNFLISVADWMAIAVERLYYAAQMSINELTEQEFGPAESFDFGHPIASSTPKNIVLESQQVPDTYQELGQPVGASTPKKLSLQQTQGFSRPMAASTPKRLSMQPTKVQESIRPSVQPTYGQFGTPMAESTPKRVLSVQRTQGPGEPVAASTPKRLSEQPPEQTQDEFTPMNLSLNPYYSFVAEKHTIVSPRKRPKKVPYYRLEQMKSSKEKSLSQCQEAKTEASSQGQSETLPMTSKRQCKTFREMEQSIKEKSTIKKKNIVMSLISSKKCQPKKTRRC